MTGHTTFKQQLSLPIATGMLLCLLVLGFSQQAQANDPFLKLSKRMALEEGRKSGALQPGWGRRQDMYAGALGLHVGTHGFGAHYFKPFGDGQPFAIRAAISFMPIRTTISGTYSDRDTESDVKATFNNADLSFHWFPLKTSPNVLKYLSVHAGALFLFKMDGELETRLSSDYHHGDIAISPEDVGVMRTSVKWERKINPVAGVGLNNIELGEYLALSVNLGCAFLSSPKVDIVGDGLLVNNTGNSEVIENNMKNYRYLPKLEVGISYTLR